MGRVLGRGYEIERRKFVISLPETWVPDWVRAEIEGVSSANINPYVRPELRVDRLTGGAGEAYFWHSCMLHGTRPNLGDRARVSVRYILQKDSADPDTLLDRANAALLGPGSLARTRVDVDESGVFLERKNVIGGNTRAD